MPQPNSPSRSTVIYIRRSSAAAANPLAQAIYCLRALSATAFDTFVIFHRRSN